MGSVLTSAPTWAIMLTVAILIVASNELGSYVSRSPLGRRIGQGLGSVVQAAAFTLVGLLLGFSFSLALARYDERRTTLVQEANAIGTTFLRTELLDRRSAAPLRRDLREYVAVRIDFALATTDPPRQLTDRDKSNEIQRHMWRLAVESTRRNPGPIISLFINSLNETIDLSATEDEVLNAHIPDIVMIGLFLIILIAAAMMGLSFERTNQRAIVAEVMYATVLALAIGLVFDLDRPQRGFVRISLEPMTTLQQEIQRQSGR